MIDTLFQGSVLSDQVIFGTSRSKRDLGRSARLHTRWTNSSVAIVSVVGDVDSTNAGDVAECVLSDLALCRALILDMTRLEFMGAAGLLRAEANIVELQRGWNRLGIRAW